MANVLVGPINTFDPKFGAIVVPVNCVGKMRRGVALEASKRWPRESFLYRARCRYDQLRPGNVYIPYWSEDFEVWFAATKDHWRDPSRLDWIVECGHAMASQSIWSHARDVAVPALGCGLGGLQWDEVREPLVEALSHGDELLTFHLCPPT